MAVEASAHDAVRKCLDDLRAHIEKITRRPIDPDVDNYTHLIETITAAYMMPDPGQKWTRLGLTFMESRLMQVLDARRGFVYSVDTILNGMYYDRNIEPECKMVDVLVCKIRKKLAEAKADSWIVTHWGHGYSLVYADAAEAYARPRTREVMMSVTAQTGKAA
jgi:DNA-binding response OmpR family regulator